MINTKVIYGNDKDLLVVVAVGLRLVADVLVVGGLISYNIKIINYY